MKEIYIDTNLIIARYKPKDPLYSIANRLFKEEKYKFVISPITLTELHSVLSRVKHQISLPKDIETIDIPTLVEFIIEDCNLKLLSKTRIVTYQIGKERVRIPLEYYIALSIADKIKLRTLDLIHIAYAYLIKDQINAFVTGDNEILEKRKTILHTLGIEVKPPQDIIN